MAHRYSHTGCSFFESILTSFAAQLKVNLRPLWKPTAEALAVLSGRFGDLTWQLVFEELHKICDSEEGMSPQPAWMSQPSDDDLDPISEEEKTWRDPSAHKLRSLVALWLRGDAAYRSIVKVSYSSYYIPSRLTISHAESSYS